MLNGSRFRTGKLFHDLLVGLSLLCIASFAMGCLCWGWDSGYGTARPAVEIPPIETVDERDRFQNEPYQLSTAYTEKNLTVYFILGESNDNREFITLEEGLQSGEVTVKEQENAQVSQLQINNRSDKPLFLQEGDRLIGGKQDRTIHTSIVIKPQSGGMPIPAFCVESGRWSNSPGSFKQANNKSLAGINTRISAKYESNQSKVWESVAKDKERAQEQLGTTTQSTSLTEAMDSEQVIQLTEAAVKRFTKALNDEPEAIGAVFLINGEIIEMDVYAGRPLFEKVFPKLVGSMATDAALKAPDAAFENPEDTDVKRWLSIERSVVGRRVLKVDETNTTTVYYNKDQSAISVSTWHQDLIHRQAIYQVNVDLPGRSPTLTDVPSIPRMNEQENHPDNMGNQQQPSSDDQW